MVSNFEQVKNWMASVGQQVPEKSVVMDRDTAALRHNLIAEETEELLQALEEYSIGVEDDDLTEDEKVSVLKEGADVLVVVYGMFAAMGIDANLIHTMVMRNNAQKVASAITREDGKIVVPPEVKEKLKEEITLILTEIVRG